MNKNKDQDTDCRLKKIEKSISDIQRKLSESKIFNSSIKTSTIERHDRIWSCEKCATRLGIYDTKNDELRVRYRDFYSWWKPGENGYLKIVCRGCSYVNEVRYTDTVNNI